MNDTRKQAVTRSLSGSISSLFVNRFEQFCFEILSSPVLAWFAICLAHSLSALVLLKPVCSVAQSWPTLWSQRLACQDPLSVEFARQEYWSGLPCPPPGDPPDPGIKPASFMSPALAAGFFTTAPTGKPP